MARSRNIKPSFCQNEILAELSYEARLAFALLPCFADREGRLEDRPKRLKMQMFPADNIDMDEIVQCLHDAGFLLRYEVAGRKYVQIVNFTKHQNPHHKETASEIPSPPGHKDSGSVPCEVTPGQRQRIMDRDHHQCVSCGDKENLEVDHITPISKGGTSADANLQILCRKCNSSKGNRHEQDYRNPSTRRQRAVNDSCKAPNVPLIPDSLNLIPDSLNLSKEGTAASPPNFWDVGKSIGLPGSLIGKWIKDHGEEKTAECIAKISIKNPADPKQWGAAYLQERVKNIIPDDVNKIEAWAKENGFPVPRNGESLKSYKQRISA